MFSIKFSFEWVYYRAEKRGGCSSINIKNNTSRFSANNNYYCHDTGRSFELIFMKFTWLVRFHTWMNPNFFFENGRFNRTTDMGENVPPKLVFWLSFSRYGGFWGKNLKAVFNTPFRHRKNYCHFCRRTYNSLKNGHVSQKSFFTGILDFFFFFWTNCYMKNIQNLISYKKIYIAPQNCHVLLQICFSQFFNINWRTSTRFSCSKVHTHSQENFMKNKFRSYKIFAEWITFWEITKWMQKSVISP